MLVVTGRVHSRTTLDRIELREDVARAASTTNAHAAVDLSEWAAALPPSVTLVVSKPAVVQVPVELGDDPAARRRGDDERLEARPWLTS